MKPKSLIITLSLLFLSISVFGQYNYTQKLGSLATVMLPDRPKFKRSDGADTYISRHNGVIFFAEAGDIGGGFKNFFHKDLSDSIYSQYINGLLKGVNGKLIYKNKIKINEHESCEFGYKAELNGHETYSYNRAVALNDTILVCSIFSSDLVSKDNPALNDFFTGFKIKSDKQLKLDHTARFAYKMGKFIGILMTLSILAALGFAVVFLIKKVAYRNKR